MAMQAHLIWGNRNCLTNISHAADFAIASTHNSSLTIIYEQMQKLNGKGQVYFLNKLRLLGSGQFG